MPQEIIGYLAVFPEYLAYTLIAAGCFCVITSVMGLFRMPDLYTKCHAAGITDAMGMILIFSGCMILFGATFASLKIFILMIILLITNPTSTYTLTSAALKSGMPIQGQKEE
jgi:multicomponent Na+:H+ antiporter subunit G